MITPTGAALLKTNVSEYTNSFTGIVIKDSFSTGQKEFKGMANFMRVSAGSIQQNISYF